MIKTIPAKLSNGKVIPLEKLKNISGFRVYVTLIPVNQPEIMTEAKFLKLAKQTDKLFKKKNLREISSLTELDV